MSHRSHPRRLPAGRLAAALALVLALTLAAAPAALAGQANGGIPGAPADPIAGLPWGVFTDPHLDDAVKAYQQSTGSQHDLLAKIVMRPLVHWWGAWVRDDRADWASSHVIANETGGNPDVLSQMAVFRMQPWEHDACTRLPSAAEQASFRTWIDGFARGIGDSRVALILQPDLPFALCAPHHSGLPFRMVSWAAGVLNALPHTTVYLDAGAGDWLTVKSAVRMLRRAGVAKVRGFALNGTHYDTTQREVLFGQQVVRALARAGIRNKHFVVNTAENGRGFTFQQVGKAFFDEPPVCTSSTQRRCATLGIPPTTDVANPRWGLSPAARSAARRLVDGYLWFGRPWLYRSAAPFLLDRALQLASSTPY